jgi:hypothetical protein
MHAFKLEMHGCTHYGAWRMTGPETLEVRSLYGTRFMPLDDQLPSKLARLALMEMVPPLVKAPGTR